MKTSNLLKINIFFLFILFISSLCWAKISSIDFIENLIKKEIGKGYSTQDFISDCLNSTNIIKLKVNHLLKTTKAKNQLETLYEILDTLKLISFQIKKLDNISSLKPTPSITPVKIKSPPYTLKIFNSNIDLLRKINISINENKKTNNILSGKIAAIRKDLDISYNKYENNKSNNKKIFIYRDLCNLISLKVQYMIFVTQQEYIKQLINRLTDIRDITNHQIEIIFKNIDIKDSNIKSIQKQKELVHKQLNLINRQIIDSNKEIDNNIIYYEIKLQKLLDKLQSNNIGKNSSKLLKIDSNSVRSLIDYYNYKKTYLKQKEISLEIKKTYWDFYYNWIVAYIKIKKGLKPTTLLDSINNLAQELQKKYQDILQQLADIRKVKISITEEIAYNLQELKNTKSLRVKRALINLTTQLKKQNKLIDDIILTLLNNKSQVQDLSLQVNLIYSLLNKRLGLITALNMWSKERLIGLYNKVKFIFFYPFAKLGNISLSLASIFKIVFSFLIGIMLLKFFRRKTTLFLEQNTKLTYGAINSLTTLGYYFSLVLLFLIVLSTAGIDLSQLSILMGALGVGIGFGLQTIANNFISGLIILTDRSIQVGDIVELEDGTMGKVKNLAIRATVIRTFDGKDIIVPNSELISNKVNTWTYSDDWRRLSIPFGVSYDADPEEVRQIAIQAARDVPITVEDIDHPILVWFEGLGDSSINFSLKVWCRLNRLDIVRTGVISDYYFSLFKRLKNAGIEIPFPQRDINIRDISPEIIKLIKENK